MGTQMEVNETNEKLVNFTKTKGFFKMEKDTSGICG